MVLEIINTIAIIAASGVAIFGINAWRKEFQGKRKIELAEDALCLFYQAERAIEAIRYPLYDLAQGQTRTPEANETPGQKQAKDRAYVIFKKIMEHGEIFDKLHKLRFRFMVSFGKETEKIFNDLKKIVDEIWVSSNKLAELWTKKLGCTATPTDKEIEIKRYERIIWSYGKDDPVKLRLENIISEVEELCKPIILGKK